jgi:hypothetical protein
MGSGTGLMFSPYSIMIVGFGWPLEMSAVVGLVNRRVGLVMLVRRVNYESEYPVIFASPQNTVSE